MEVLTISHIALAVFLIFLFFAFFLLITRLEWESIEVGDVVYTKNYSGEFDEDTVEFLSWAGFVQTSRGKYTYLDYLRGRIKIN